MSNPVPGWEPLTGFSLEEMDTMEFPPVEWVIDGMIASGSLNLLVGRPKAGKSLVSIDMACSVALGEPFIGRATAQGPVIYLPAEDALRLVRDRLFVRLGTERTAPLIVVPADGSIDQSVQLDDADSFMRLEATVRAHNPRLLILDPLRELHHRKENDADDMAALLRPLRQLAHETDTAIILIHHRNKHATDPSLASRGSSAISGGVDSILTLELSDEETAGDGLNPDQTLTIRIEGRYGPRQKLGARLRTGLRWESVDPSLRDDLSVADRIRRYLESTGDELTADELVDAIGADRRTVQNELSRLAKDGKVRRSGPGTKTAPFHYRAVVMHREARVNQPVSHISASTQGNTNMVHDVTGTIGGSVMNHPSRPVCRQCGAEISTINQDKLCGRCARQAVAS